MQNIEICYIVQIWRVSYQIAHRNNIFFGVRADRYIATLCRKNAFFGLRAEILLSTQVQVPGGYLDSRAGPFLGYVKKYWFFGEIFTSGRCVTDPPSTPKVYAAASWTRLINFSRKRGQRAWVTQQSHFCLPKVIFGKNLAVFVHLARQLDHVLCRIEGEVNHFQNPLQLALITCSSRL